MQYVFHREADGNESVYCQGERVAAMDWTTPLDATYTPVKDLPGVDSEDTWTAIEMAEEAGFWARPFVVPLRVVVDVP